MPYYTKPTLTIMLFFAVIAPSWSYRLIYKEQLYELYHQHLYPNVARNSENIYWLERVLRADFANPLHALAKIENEQEWECYRYLFTMHVNLKLTELYVHEASLFFKHKAYFYNWPWKEENIKSLNLAEERLRYALVYWEEAVRWSHLVSNQKWIFLEEIQNWHDENLRIENGRLNYQEIINRHLIRLYKIRDEFLAMDENTY